MGIARKSFIQFGIDELSKKEALAFCAHCDNGKRQKFVLGLLKAVNGAMSARWWCSQCCKCADSSGGNIAKSALKKAGVDINSLPVMKHNEWFPCERCGDETSEEHHWAPYELFEDADDWPKSYLCVTCHMKWHQVINTHRSRR